MNDNETPEEKAAREREQDLEDAQPSPDDGIILFKKPIKISGITPADLMQEVRAALKRDNYIITSGTDRDDGGDLLIDLSNLGQQLEAIQKELESHDGGSGSTESVQIKPKSLEEVKSTSVIENESV